MSVTLSWPDPGEIEIEPEAVAALQASGSPFRLIDCREPEEWDLTHLPGASLLPLSTFAEKYPAALTDPQEHLVIHCHHGMRSAKATLFLRQKGYRHVWSMARGIEGWSLEVDPGIARY